MPSNFPSTVDTLVNPASTDKLNSPSHSLQHINANDSIEAIEGYLIGAKSVTKTVSSGTDGDYVCNGVADNVQIQEAIDSLGTYGGTVFIKKGTYNLTDVIQLVNGGTIDKIHLCGEGKELTILKMSNGANKGAVIAGKSDRSGGITTTGVIIENLTVDFNGANQAIANNLVGMDINTFEQCRVSNCKVLNVVTTQGLSASNYGIGILTFDADKSIIENCYFDNCDNGIFVTTAAQGDEHYFIINNNIIKNSVVNGIWHESGIKTIISNNFITGSGGSGIYANDHDLTDLAQTQVVNNQIYSSGNYGIVIKGQNWKINDNIIRDSAWDGISASGLYNDISNNTIINSGTSLSGNPYLRTGIWINGSYVTCEGNNIFDTQATPTTQRGIYLTSVNDCTIVGNNIVNVLTYGIDLTTANFNVISNNKINNCGQATTNTYAGIVLQSTSTYNSITGNNIVDSASNKSKYGIQEVSASDDFNIITGNIIVGAITSKILRLGANTLISENTDDFGGWTAFGGVWSYASATGIAVPTGAATRHNVGDKIRYQNNSSGTYLYDYVVAIADTLLTVAGDPVPNATLTNRGYSKAETPQGFPNSFTKTVNATSGWTSTVSCNYNYSIHGNLCHLYNGNTEFTGTGTSNATTCVIPLPVAAANANAYCSLLAYGSDSGTNQGTPMTVTVSGSAMTVYKSFFQTAFATSGTKQIYVINGFYQI